MPDFKESRRLSVIVVLLLLVPAIPSEPASGGSAWSVSGPAFQNGTAANVTPAAPGIKLPCDQSRLGNWTRVDPWPSARNGANMVYDDVHDAVVLFGGQDNDGLKNDTWAYYPGNDTWRQLHPTISPSPRIWHSMSFDSANGVVVLFGGEGVSKAETWTFNLSTDTWTNMYPNRNPAYRVQAGMAYDSVSRVSVLYGGGSNYNNETWAYDYVANSWTAMSPGQAPPAVGAVSMAYDPLAGAMVLYGGYDISNNLLCETWLYNLSANKWTNMSPSQPPIFQYEPVITCEESTGSVILYGESYREAGNTIPATWSYNSRSNTWTNLTPPVMPDWRDRPAMVYDPVRDRTMIFGGGNFPFRHDDTWIYNTTANKWARTTANPGQLFGAGMAYDSENGVVIHFGGSLHYYSQFINDTYVYDLKSRSWTNRHPAKSPSARIVPGMAYDSRNGVTILFGGLDGIPRDDTWAYNFSQNTWKQMKPQNAPSPRTEPSMAYDRDNGVVVLYGDVEGRLGKNDTWTYNYTTDTWTEMNPALGPPAEGLYQSLELVYDGAARRILLFTFGDSQYGGMNQTWSYNVSANVWTNLTTADTPPMRGHPGIAYDDVQGLALMYGGTGGPNSVWADTWAYYSSNNTWKRLAPGCSMGRRAGPTMLYDGVNDAILFMDGAYEQVSYDVWAYDLKQYKSSGNWTSRAEDLGGTAYFGSIAWDGANSSNTTLGFQLRTADTADALNATPFVGPDGTDASFYTKSGESIAGAHNGTRWMQYRAFLCTTNPAETPVLRGVTITYNLIHDLSILSPAGGENWTGNHNISWSAADPDNDTMKVDLYLLSGTGSTTLAKDLPAAAGSWEWNTTTTPSGDYRLRVVARDDNASIPLEAECTSVVFTVFHPIPNRLPKSNLLYPADNATINTTNVTLEWTGSDEDGDPLNYSVYIADVAFGPESLPELYSFKEENTSGVNGLEDGMTYFWTVVAFDGKDNGTVPDIRRFTVDLPPVPVNHPPAIGLLRPADCATVNATEVALEWSGTDEDNDSLTYVPAWCAGPFASGTPVCVTTNETTITLTGLTDGTTYYWMVTASDGKDNTTSAVRRFNVSLPVPNRPPRITSTPGTNATVNETYYYNLTATDADNDTLLYELASFPAGMELNRTTGRLQWKPSQTGSFGAVVRVSDGKGGSDQQGFNITVSAAPPVKPRCSFNSTFAEALRGKVTLRGTAGPGPRAVTQVQVSVDGGGWVDALGTSEWTFVLDTAKLKNGQHSLRARSFDGTNYSDEISAGFEVRNAAPLPAEEGFPWWILAVAMLLVVTAVVATVMVRRRKSGPSPGGGADGPAEEPVEAGPGPEEPAPEDAKKPLPPEAEEIAIKPEGKPAPAAAAAAPPKPEPTKIPPVPPAPALRTAPEGFAVEDMFLMYEDGRLIQHSTRRIKADMDADIMASMLTAVKAFIKESVGMAEGTELGAMEYGDNKILLQKGRHVVLAAVITGAEPADFRDEMKHAVSNIEGEFGPVLASWDGMAAKLAGAKKFLGQLGAYKVAEPAAAEKARTDVSLRSELEFYQGFVRLKVAIKNSMDTYMNDASFRLIYKDAVLRLDHIEPKYALKGDEVVLGNIEPREKKTVAFYLDPQICTESFIEGILSFKDSRGNLEMLKLPRKVASVVCPIVYTDENINVAMLKRMAAEELDKKDTKVFSLPPGLAPKIAFDLAEAAVQHHDLRLVREFTEKEPFVGEAWYYGKAKGREDKLVVRARVLGEKKVLEFFVASGSTLMLTGMLAELKADLNKELESQKGRPEMKQVTAPDEVDAVAQVRTLLDKAAGSELAAGETEMGR